MRAGLAITIISLWLATALSPGFSCGPGRGTGSSPSLAIELPDASKGNITRSSDDPLLKDSSDDELIGSGGSGTDMATVAVVVDDQGAAPDPRLRDRNCWEVLQTGNCWLMLWGCWTTLGAYGVLALNLAQICESFGRTLLL